MYKNEVRVDRRRSKRTPRTNVTNLLLFIIAWILQSLSSSDVKRNEWSYLPELRWSCAPDAVLQEGNSNRFATILLFSWLARLFIFLFILRKANDFTMYILPTYTQACIFRDTRSRHIKDDRVWQWKIHIFESLGVSDKWILLLLQIQATEILKFEDFSFHHIEFCSIVS